MPDNSTCRRGDGTPDAYAPFADEYDRVARATSSRRYGNLLRLLPRTADRALDAGCGSGDLALRLAEDFRHVVGMDLSPSMLALAGRHKAEAGRDNASFVRADLERLPFADASFDFVVSTYALHRTRLEVTLPDLRRLVRPGGRMVIIGVVSRWPRFHASPVVQVLVAFMSAPGYLTYYGARAGWRIVRFFASRPWVRHISGNRRPTPKALRDALRRFLPGSRIGRLSRWALTIVWDAPRAGAESPDR